jgi:hypothetical protein
MANLPFAFSYDAAKLKIITGEINITTHSFKMMLATSVYVPNKETDAVYATVLPYEASGAGYTAGGWALTTTFTQVGPLLKLDAVDIIALALDAPWKYAIIYDNTHASKALLCYYNAAVPQTPGGFNYHFAFAAGGILTLTDGY